MTASPLKAWSSAGVFTEMEDTGDKAAGEKRSKKSNHKRDRVTITVYLKFLCPDNPSYVRNPEYHYYNIHLFHLKH